MASRDSRVAQEAREAQQRAQEVQRKIKDLSTQIANPQKYFTPKPDERSQSTVERFRRYFALIRPESRAETRKPTRAEKRAQRNTTIVLAILAFILLIWVVGYALQVLGRHSNGAN